jgi:hypothetical protein
MGISKRVCIWLLSFIAIAWTGGALMSRHFELQQEERYRDFAHDQALDRKFKARASTPLEIRAMITTSRGNYQVPAELPSFQDHIASLGKLPAIIVLPSCGFAVRGKNVPMNVAVLSLDEDPRLITSKTSTEACMSNDGKSLQDALVRQLKFAMEYVKNADWIDGKRVMVVGLGEAAPLVAAYDGPIKQRITLGDPCLVPWMNIARRTPMLMLFTSDPQGLAEKNGRQQSLDIAALGKGDAPALPPVKACAGLNRPSIPPSVRQAFAQGRLGMISMPAALESAQKAAYEEL